MPFLFLALGTEIVTAQHCLSDHLGQSIIYDLFIFIIEKENLLFERDVSIELSTCYEVIGQQILDNNGGKNYHVGLATHVDIKQKLSIFP